MIRFENLTKIYRGIKAVDDLNLQIPQGTIFGFIGPNGAGKTTTIKMMAGVLRPTRGRIYINGLDIAKEPSKAKQIIGFIPDRPFLYEKLSGLEFLTFKAGLYGMKEDRLEEKIWDLLDLFELREWADELIEQGQYLKAKAYLEQAKKSKRLNEAQIKRVKVTLERVDAKIDEQKRLMADLYKRSRKHYKQGNIEKALEGFAIVASSGLYVPRMGKTAEQYLAMIEQRPVQAQKPAKLQIPRPEPEKPLVLPAVPAEQYGNEPMRGSLIRENVKHSYLKAVIRDAEARANMHVGKAEFSIAKAVVQNAEKVLQKYRPDIEPHLYDQHNERLQKLTRMVNEQQRRWELRWDTKDSGL